MGAHVYVKFVIQGSVVHGPTIMRSYLELEEEHISKLDQKRIYFQVYSSCWQNLSLYHYSLGVSVL